MRGSSARRGSSTISAILDDPTHPQFATASDALNYATLVAVARSFSEFMEALRPRPD